MLQLKRRLAFGVRRLCRGQRQLGARSNGVLQPQSSHRRLDEHDVVSNVPCRRSVGRDVEPHGFTPPRANGLHVPRACPTHKPGVRSRRVSASLAGRRLVLGAFDDVYGLCDTDLITGRVFRSSRRGCAPTAISRTPAHDHARGVGRVGSVGRGRAYFCRVTGSSTTSHH